MNIATWNVNSVRARLPRLIAWIETHRPDLLCIQETKAPDAYFPRAELESLGYAIEFFGQKTYNGVAILARGALTDAVRGLPGDTEESEKRVIAATFDGVRVVNVYVPNGQEVGCDKYVYKLAWLDRLRAMLARTHTPDQPLVLCGDFNIAPDDRDVYDPDLWRGKVLFSEPERAKLRDLMGWGLSDALRLRTQEPGQYTWWDYRMNGFKRDLGLRLDHFLVTAPVAARVREIVIDREERAGEKPSDHAPVVLTLG
jgi:exodeoxyribonuclease-3